MIFLPFLGLKNLIVSSLQPLTILVPSFKRFKLMQEALGIAIFIRGLRVWFRQIIIYLSEQLAKTSQYLFKKHI